MTIKIQKILSDLGYGSRRSIEKLIQLRQIVINGEIAIIGQRINEEKTGTILISGKKIFLKKRKCLSQVLIYNKAEGEICTRYDEKKRRTVFDNLPPLKMNRWISVGRLDLNTQGLLLFTNDGTLANKLMHPRYAIEREYYVRVFGTVNQHVIDTLKNGLKIHNEYFYCKDVILCKSIKNGKNVWLKIILCQGKNREIRSMLKAVECQVNRLIRIRYGNIVLPPHLKKGHWMKLNSQLVHGLHHLLAHGKY